MQIVRKASLKTTPWKNGGGVTREISRHPADGLQFRWRLSIAQIDVAGPFSDFTGYDRTMVLLRGSGVRLTFDAADPVSLNRVGDMAEFDGALKTDCQLLRGSCTDLNLMIARSSNKATATVERIVERAPLPDSPHGTLLVFGITGLLLQPDTGPMARLAPWDTAILPANAGGVVTPDLDREAASLVFFATVDDNSA